MWETDRYTDRHKDMTENIIVAPFGRDDCKRYAGMNEDPLASIGLACKHA